jgi:hypothetical protein
MSAAQVHVPDQPRSLELTGFHLQLRRLESLQTLMVQGGTVVSEVAQFIVRAREELSAMQQEHTTYAGAHANALEEKGALLQRISELEKQCAAAEGRALEQAVTIEALRTKIAGQESDSAAEAEWRIERRRTEERLSGALERVTALESALERERTRREASETYDREEQVAQHTAEIALLKSRLAAVEQQLVVERERRSRLMEVVRTHDVTVASRLQREEA